MSNGTAIAEAGVHEGEKDLNSLAEISGALEALGYKAKLQESSISVSVGHGIIASMMMKDEEKNELVILCHLVKLGEILPDDGAQSAAILIELLDHNTVIRPFAIACIGAKDGEDVPPEDYGIVLVDSLVLGDFSTLELKKCMENLNRAVVSTAKLLQAIRSQTQ